MNKRAIFILVLVIIFVIFFYLGFTFQRESAQNEVIKNDMLLEENNNELNNIETLETISQDEKTTPNTILILKKYYTDCGHTIEGQSEIPEEMVNLSKEEIAENYPDWEIEEFSQERIVLSKTLDSFCGEHYYLTDENGYISVYTIDENENKVLKKQGEISTEYLTETDKISLKNGIMVYGTEELNKLLEDFEG